MVELTVREALRAAMAEEMRADDDVFLMGEEVAEYQGAYKVSQGLLQEFGLTIAGDVEIRVWDSNAELRYMVLPMRPAGTEDMSNEQLAELISRDSMVGTAVVKTP